jgi:hypothetical protein
MNVFNCLPPFPRQGVLRTAAINWRTIVQYHLGADP